MVRLAGVRIPLAASKVHGLTDEMVRFCDGWRQVGAQLASWIASVAEGRRVELVAHNARYDVSLLRTENTRHGVAFVDFTYVDTLKICRAAFPELPSHRQALVYEHVFGRLPDGEHSSVGDVRALKEICASEKVAPMMRPTTIHTYFVKKTHKRCKTCSTVFSTYFKHTCMSSPRN